MSVRVLLAICVVLLFSFVKSSSIITRDMIRTPRNPPTLDDTSHNRSTGPEQLITNTENAKYQLIFPPERNDSVYLRRSLGSPSVSTTPSNNISPSNLQPTVQSYTDKPLFSASSQNRQGDEKSLSQVWSPERQIPYSKNDLEEISSTPPTPNTSSEELSKQYWKQYKNFSYDFFNTSGYLQAPVSDLIHDKGYQETNVWNMIQRLFECSWSLGIFNCLREGFKLQETPFLNFPEPEFPRFHQGDNMFHQALDSEDFDMDEGRKKLSKKLQMLLPILMMLKMTMLPALAVMALVSGKAFLMSLLSLGVALVAASVHPAALAASKRHEIAPQAPPTSEHLPSNYYYVM